MYIYIRTRRYVSVHVSMFSSPDLSSASDKKYVQQFIYIYIHTYMYTYTAIYVSLSLYLYIYIAHIYIYEYNSTMHHAPCPAVGHRGHLAVEVRQEKASMALQEAAAPLESREQRGFGYWLRSIA